MFDQMFDGHYEKGEVLVLEGLLLSAIFLKAAKGSVLPVPPPLGFWEGIPKLEKGFMPLG